MSGTSESAKRAWETIRANKKVRHEAALKANITRGKKGRSAAALKAWETRRAAK